MLQLSLICQVLLPIINASHINIFADLCKSFLCNPYKITTRSLSRRSNYSLRHIFRFLSLPNIRWIAMRLSLFKHFIYQENQHYVAIIDEVVEAKSGHCSYGLSHFYSSIAQKTINSVCFFNLCFVNVATKIAYSIGTEQVIFTEKDKERIAVQKQALKEGKERAKKGEKLAKGRKKGTKNKTEKKSNDTTSFRTFKTLWDNVITETKNYLPKMKITHLLADSKYATQYYIDTIASVGCFLISKLNRNACLYEVYMHEEGEKKGKGRPKKYGKKIDFKNLDKKYFKETIVKDGQKQDIYQMQTYSQSIKNTILNVVIIIKKNDKSNDSFSILFSNDTSLTHTQIMDYYQMRFQIEFEFRDAKQMLGLSDFKNYKKVNLTNFVNLIFTMCLISKILLEDYRVYYNKPKMSLADLKNIFHARFRGETIIKFLGISDNNNFYLQKIKDFIPNDLINND
ncbi:MAG: hypothetical protein EAZ87_24835 [Nostocales cyanobacterium]|nr:MAG: hypothetical protein EAZ87_24835 [Nostocales cyanobacterium]